MTYAITGASGHLGRLTADALLQRTDPSEIVLITRDPDRLAEYADRGVQVRAGDFDRPETLDGAFAGVDDLLIISTDAVGSRVEGHRRAVEAAERAGVRRVLYTSFAELTDDHPAGVAPDHAATEVIIRGSGLAWTMLRNNLYADMQVDQIRAAAESGQWVTNTGEGATAYVTRADCAAVAAAALVATDLDGALLDVTGPQALTATDLAGLAAGLRGSEVTVVQITDAELVAGMVEAGLPAPVAELLASFGTGAREGLAARVTSVVSDLAGRPATPLSALL